MKEFNFESFDKSNDLYYGCNVSYSDYLFVVGSLMCALFCMNVGDKLVITCEES